MKENKELAKAQKTVEENFYALTRFQEEAELSLTKSATSLLSDDKNTNEATKNIVGLDKYDKCTNVGEALVARLTSIALSSENEMMSMNAISLLQQLATGVTTKVGGKSSSKAGKSSEPIDLFAMSNSKLREFTTRNK